MFVCDSACVAVLGVILTQWGVNFYKKNKCTYSITTSLRSQLQVQQWAIKIMESRGKLQLNNQVTASQDWVTLNLFENLLVSVHWYCRSPLPFCWCRRRQSQLVGTLLPPVKNTRHAATDSLRPAQTTNAGVRITLFYICLFVYIIFFNSWSKTNQSVVFELRDKFWLMPYFRMFLIKKITNIITLQSRPNFFLAHSI